MASHLQGLGAQWEATSTARLLLGRAGEVKAVFPFAHRLVLPWHLPCPHGTASPSVGSGFPLPAQPQHSGFVLSALR